MHAVMCAYSDSHCLIVALQSCRAHSVVMIAHLDVVGPVGHGGQVGGLADDTGSPSGAALHNTLLQVLRASDKINKVGHGTHCEEGQIKGEQANPD